MASVKCPKCNHSQPDRMVRCLYCGEPLGTTASAPARTCPACKKAMSAVPAGWVLIDRCDGCLGEFYDAGELERVKKLSDGDGKWIRESSLDRDGESLSARICPGCKGRMESVLAAYEVTIDICRKCQGVWCDKGEADRLRALAIDRRQPSGVVPADIQGEADELAWKLGLAGDIVFDSMDGGDRAYRRVRHRVLDWDPDPIPGDWKPKRY